MLLSSLRSRGSSLLETPAPPAGDKYISQTPPSWAPPWLVSHLPGVLIHFSLLPSDNPSLSVGLAAGAGVGAATGGDGGWGWCGGGYRGRCRGGG